MGCGCQKGTRTVSATLHRVEWDTGEVDAEGQAKMRVRRYVSKAEAVTAMALRPGGTYYAPSTS